MTTPRKARQAKIHTRREDVTGALVDESVPDGVEKLLANLAPGMRRDALSAIGEALGLYRDQVRKDGPTRAEAIADLRAMTKCADELQQHLDRFPPIAHAEADLILHRQGLPFFVEYRREIAARLRGLESLAVVIERKLQSLPVAGAPSAQPRRMLYDAFAQVASRYGITFHKAPDFAKRAFKSLAIKPPSPDRRVREK